MEIPAKIGKITGPPGTGKSTEILRLIERACEKYFPNKIGAVSFTVAAVEEIRSRIAKLTGESRDVIKNVRTIHSHCFKLLGLTKERVADKKISEFNEAHPEFAINSKKLEKQDEDVTLRNNKRNNYMERLFAQIQHHKKVHRPL